MATYQCCRECGLTFGKKALVFHEKKNDYDNRALLAELGIHKVCCRNAILTAIIDEKYWEMKNKISVPEKKQMSGN